MDTDSSRYSAAAVMYGTKVHFVRFGKERLADGCDAVVDGHNGRKICVICKMGHVLRSFVTSSGPVTCHVHFSP